MTKDAVWALLAFGCVCETVCVVGVLWLRDGFDQLHFAGASSTVGLFAFVAAVALQRFASAAGTIDCLAALVLTFLLNPVMVAATGRAGRRLRGDDLEPTAEERARS